MGNLAEKFKNINEGITFKKCLKCGSDLMLIKRKNNLINFRCQNCGVKGELVLPDDFFNTDEYTNLNTKQGKAVKPAGTADIFPLKWDYVLQMNLSEWTGELDQLRGTTCSVPFTGRMQDLSKFCFGYWRQCLSCPHYINEGDNTFCLLHSIVYGGEGERDARIDLWKSRQKKI